MNCARRYTRLLIHRPRAFPFRTPLLYSQRRRKHAQRSTNPADNDPDWVSELDRDPVLVRSRRTGHWGVWFLAIFPITAFALGAWQIQRLRWKTDLLARHEDALSRPPAILPDHIDADLPRAEEYRRVLVRGTFRHDQEMLLGPRVRDGVNGYFVITPMERPGGDKILVNRGWIPKARREQKTRKEGLPTGEVIVEGLLRAPWKKNYFTPDNRPDKGEFYFSDVAQMAALTGAKPVWIEETMRLELMELMRRMEKGVPVGRHAEVNLSNNHAQYIATWFGVGIATTIMFGMLLKKHRSRGFGSKRTMHRVGTW